MHCGRDHVIVGCAQISSSGVTTFMEFQNGSQDIHPLTSLSSCLHFSDIMLEQCEEGVIAKAPGLKRSSTMVQKVMMTGPWYMLLP